MKALSHAALTLLGMAVCCPSPAADCPPPPGLVVAHSPASSEAYLGSPSLVALPNGDLAASHDFFGPGSSQDTTIIYRSQDGGNSWRQLATVKGAFWSSLFVHNGLLYLLGTSKQEGFVVIRRSSDGGATWTEPTNAISGLLLGDGKYHCAPGPVVEHDGRVWRAFEDLGGPGSWPEYFRSFVISARAESDLLAATNWVCSERMGRDPAWLSGQFRGWLEGNAVVSPNGGIFNVLRVDGKFEPEKAAIIRISANGERAAFDPASGFIVFPGGCKKFTIRRDPRDGSYWSLSNFVPEADRVGNPERTRNTLALVHSPDLLHWKVQAVLMHHPDATRHGFQYADWQFDGDDLIALVRTSFDDAEGGAHNQHDSNFILFRRWKNFRELGR